MAGLAQELVNVLNEQLINYQNIVESGDRKKTAIIENNIIDLKKINSEEHLFVGKIQRLDKTRLVITRDISNVLNVKESNITIDMIANAMKGQPESEELSKIAAELKSTMDILRVLNQENSALLKNALEYIDFSINVIRSTMEIDAGYFAPNGEIITKSGSLLDKKN